jgi:hypothetical protein
MPAKARSGRFYFLEREMPDAYLYSVDGKYSFYQEGQYFYSAQDNECEFYQCGDHFYSMETDETLFYKTGSYLYSMDGTARYYFA